MTIAPWEEPGHECSPMKGDGPPCDRCKDHYKTAELRRTFDNWTVISDEQRLTFLEEKFPCCRSCGGLRKPCHCENDE